MRTTGKFRTRRTLQGALYVPALILFLFGSVRPAALFIHLINENHYSILEDYHAVDHIAFRTMEIKQSVERSLEKPLDNASFWKIFFTQDQKKAKKARQNRVRLIYIYLDQQRAGRGGIYISYFDKLKLTAEDLNKIRLSLSENERYILDGLIFLYVPTWKRSSVLDLWDLSKISSAGYREFEFLWAFLSIETLLSPDIIAHTKNLSTEKAINIISQLIRNGFAPAIHLQGFIDMTFNNNPKKAFARFEKSHQKGYRPEVCSAVLGYLYRRLRPDRPDKAEYYLTQAVYNYGYEIMKSDLLDLYLETNNAGKAFPVAQEIAENFINFSTTAFLRSMKWLSSYFYNKKGRKERDINKSYFYMETARIAAMDYGLPEHLLRYEHSRALTRRLSSKQQKQLTDRALRLYHIKKNHLFYPRPSTDPDCHSRLFH